MTLVVQRSQKGETAQGRAVKLKDSILDLGHISRSSRSSNFDDYKLNALLKEVGQQTTRKFAEKIGRTPMTVVNHLNPMSVYKTYFGYLMNSLNPLR